MSEHVTCCYECGLPLDGEPICPKCAADWESRTVEELQSKLIAEETHEVELTSQYELKLAALHRQYHDPFVGSISRSCNKQVLLREIISAKSEEQQPVRIEVEERPVEELRA